MNSSPRKPKSSQPKGRRPGKAISVTRIENKRLISSGRLKPGGVLLDKEEMGKLIELLRKYETFEDRELTVTHEVTTKVWWESWSLHPRPDEIVNLVPTVKSQPQSTRASANGELLLSILLNKDEQEAAIGDFLELYAQKLERLGKLRADIWAYSDIARTVWPVLRRKLAEAMGIVGAAEWIRRHLW